MITQLRHWRQHAYTAMQKTGSQLGRPAAFLAAATCALLSLASAAFASTSTLEPLPPAGGQYGPVPSPTIVTRVITVGGMPGWQIALIAVGAALVAAATAVILDRALAHRRPVAAMTA